MQEGMLVADDSHLPKKIMILIALVQGLLLLLLHQSIELKFWPYQDPQWLFCFYSIATVTPTMLLLSLINGIERKIYLYTLPFSLLVLLVGYYIGSQLVPLSHIRYSQLLFVFVVTLIVATFKGLMYVQIIALGEPLSYSRLFRLSWVNFLTLALSLFFSLCVWGVFMLWAGLFKAIKINFFYDLFTNRWFFYPALALANGFGVIIFRQQSSIIDTIRGILQALSKFLLIILVFVSLLFLVALPFTGLEPLWQTGGSMLIICMQALILFLLNSVYQDDPEFIPYPLILHRFIYLSIAILPVYSAICFYGLSLRVDQYGWTLLRCWAFLLSVVFSLFALGYLWGIVKYRDHWLTQLSWVNVRLGLIVLALMFIVNTPVMDFRKISLNSQLARLDSGEVSLEDFDYAYLRNHLATPGYRALQEIKERVSLSHPEIVIRIESLYANDRVGGPSSEELILSAINQIDMEMPEGLGGAIYKELANNRWRLSQNRGYFLLPLDLNEDNGLEYILVEERKDWHGLTLFYLEGSQWKNATISSIDGIDEKAGAMVLEAIKENKVSTRETKWKDIDIGGVHFEVR